MDPQTFLAEQSQKLDAFRQEDIEQAEKHARKTGPSAIEELIALRDRSAEAAKAMLDEIDKRPYKINVGGI